jgi:NADH-quinone oxidoreductase subunit G
VTAKVRATKFHPLSERIVLDNERCILCSRCVRFTREISKSNALGIVQRGDMSLVRAAEDHPLDADDYSDNVIDICPVGALLSRPHLYKSRVWYLKPTPSICPGCARGCTCRSGIASPSGSSTHWTHNRTCASNASRHWRTLQSTAHGSATKAATLPRSSSGHVPSERCRTASRSTRLRAIDTARRLIERSKQRVAIVSNWGSNEELLSFQKLLGGRFTTFFKEDHQPVPGETVQDDLLLRADKNPNTAAAQALFSPLPDDARAFGDETDLVLVWGEGFDFARLPLRARTIVLNAYLQPANAQADVFIPVTIQTERHGHYTISEGVVSAFEPCFPKSASVTDAEALFVEWSERVEMST